MIFIELKGKIAKTKKKDRSVLMHFLHSKISDIENFSKLYYSYVTYIYIYSKAFPLKTGGIS